MYLLDEIKVGFLNRLRRSDDYEFPEYNLTADSSFSDRLNYLDKFNKYLEEHTKPKSDWLDDYQHTSHKTNSTGTNQVLKIVGAFLGTFLITTLVALICWYLKKNSESRPPYFTEVNSSNQIRQNREQPVHMPLTIPLNRPDNVGSAHSSRAGSSHSLHNLNYGFKPHVQDALPPSYNEAVANIEASAPLCEDATASAPPDCDDKRTQSKETDKN